MPNDVRPDYPIKALLIGGPMHGKFLHLEQSALKEGYTCVESSMYADSVPPVPANAGYNESKYTHRADVTRYLGNDVHGFVHEVALIPGARRYPLILAQSKDRLEGTSESLKEQVAEVKRLQSDRDDLEAEVARYRRELASIRRTLGAAEVILGDVAEAMDAL